MTRGRTRRSLWLSLALTAATACVRAPVGGLVAGPVAREPSPASRPAGTRLLEGQIGLIAVAGSDLYVASRGRLLRSGNQGRTFAPWSEDPLLCVDSMVVAPSDGTLYVAADTCPEGDVRYPTESLFVSRDRGATWRRWAVAPRVLLGVDPLDARIVYAESGGSAYRREVGLLRSDDGGASWLGVNPPAGMPELGDYLIAGDGSVYYVDCHYFARASSPSGLYFVAIYRSGDRGATWQEIASSLGPVVFRPAVALDDGSLLGFGEDNGVVLRASRSRIGVPVLHSASAGTVGCSSTIVTKGRRACAILDYDQVAASDDEGATWRLVPLPHARARRSCVPFGDDRLLIAADDGLYEATVPR